ncbi:MAG: helix-turn-helix domain-containing protein [Clostridia bacterium]|nr:helix-turn-helix domain-containing protein [Clostridia bacterium]
MEKESVEFKRTVAQKNTTLEAVATALGIDRSTLYRKTKGGLSSLTIGEAKRITKFLNLSDKEATELFWRQ